jgi:hypothetical protein
LQLDSIGEEPSYREESSEVSERSGPEVTTALAQQKRGADEPRIIQKQLKEEVKAQS